MDDTVGAEGSVGPPREQSDPPHTVAMQDQRSKNNSPQLSQANKGYSEIVRIPEANGGHRPTPAVDDNDRNVGEAASKNQSPQVIGENGLLENVQIPEANGSHSPTPLASDDDRHRKSDDAASKNQIPQVFNENGLSENVQIPEANGGNRTMPVTSDNDRKGGDAAASKNQILGENGLAENVSIPEANGGHRPITVDDRYKHSDDDHDSGAASNQIPLLLSENSLVENDGDNEIGAKNDENTGSLSNLGTTSNSKDFYDSIVSQDHEDRIVLNESENTCQYSRNKSQDTDQDSSKIEMKPPVQHDAVEIDTKLREIAERIKKREMLLNLKKLQAEQEELQMQARNEEEQITRMMELNDFKIKMHKKVEETEKEVAKKLELDKKNIEKATKQEVNKIMKDAKNRVQYAYYNGSNPQTL